MDNLTHSLTGALIGQTGLKKKTGLAMPALILGANLPDIDGVCMFIGTQSLALRRGLTHGPIAWLILPLVLAGLLYGWDRWQARRGKRPEGRLPVNFKWLFLLSLIACLSHPALDWMNVYGVRLLEPFSSRWFYGDVLFIIDIWLWALLIFTTWFSLRREKRGGQWMKPARVGLAVMLAYIGLNAGITYAAESRHAGQGEAGQGEIVIASPPPFAFWSREIIVGDARGNYTINGVDVGAVTGLAQCDLDSVARTDSTAAAYLFWSRTPFVTRSRDGDGWVVRDARYTGRGEGAFALPVPAWACQSVQSADGVGQ